VQNLQVLYTLISSFFVISFAPYPLSLPSSHWSLSLSCLFISLSLCLLHLSTSTSCHILTNTTSASTIHRTSAPVPTRHRAAYSTSSPSGKLGTTAGPPLICSRTSPNPPTCERSLVHEALGDRQNALGYGLTLDRLYAGGQDLRLYYRLCA
jgi:hypothetical protein